MSSEYLLFSDDAGHSFAGSQESGDRQRFAAPALDGDWDDGARDGYREQPEKMVDLDGPVELGNDPLMDKETIGHWKNTTFHAGASAQEVHPSYQDDVHSAIYHPKLGEDNHTWDPNDHQPKLEAFNSEPVFKHYLQSNPGDLSIADDAFDAHMQTIPRDLDMGSDQGQTLFECQPLISDFEPSKERSNTGADQWQVFQSVDQSSDNGQDAPSSASTPAPKDRLHKSSFLQAQTTPYPASEAQTVPQPGPSTLRRKGQCPAPGCTASGSNMKSVNIFSPVTI
jgi:hypothetical protein